MKKIDRIFIQFQESALDDMWYCRECDTELDDEMILESDDNEYACGHCGGDVERDEYEVEIENEG